VPQAPQVELAAVSRRWGAQVALADLSLTIAPGTRVAVVGPSGSGKTTLLRLVMGALLPSAGQVRIDDVDLARAAPKILRRHRRRCGLIDQGSLLIPQITVHGNVVAGLVPDWPWHRILASVVWSLERERVGALLAEVGLADRQWDRARTLSGGQQQRVAIARALASEPGILLADEPTAALDPTTSAEVVQLLVAEARARQATLIVCTHRIAEVKDHMDRVIGLRAGRLAFDLPPTELGENHLDALYEGTRDRA
jgi:phosphonate transport system ATP-binding protein